MWAHAHISVWGCCFVSANSTIKIIFKFYECKICAITPSANLHSISLTLAHPSLAVSASVSGNWNVVFKMVVCVHSVVKCRELLSQPSEKKNDRRAATHSTHHTVVSALPECNRNELIRNSGSFSILCVYGNGIWILMTVENWIFSPFCACHFFSYFYPEYRQWCI